MAEDSTDLSLAYCPHPRQVSRASALITDTQRLQRREQLPPDCGQVPGWRGSAWPFSALAWAVAVALLLAAHPLQVAFQVPRRVGIQKYLVAGTNVHQTPFQQPSSNIGVVWAGESALNKVQGESSWGDSQDLIAPTASAAGEECRVPGRPLRAMGPHPGVFARPPYGTGLMFKGERTGRVGSCR